MTRIHLMNCPIDSLDRQQTIDLIEQYIKDRHPRQHVVVNVAKFVEMQKDQYLREIITSCDLINADGMPIVWASRLLDCPLPCRVAGVDLFQDLIQLSAERGYKPFFFGAKELVVKKVVEESQRKYPTIDIAGYRNGYYTEEEEQGIAEMIRDSRADILFVGFSSPRKEKFLNRWMTVMRVPFSMGVGGSFDILAGKTKRAPMWMQQCGLEWFYRLLQEPKRMFMRYAKTNPAFVWMVLREFVKLKMGKK